jgi:hypothetical protein
MNQQEEVFEDFCKNLKISFSNASTYFKEHPLFIKSVNSLKIKIDAILTFLNPLKIGITPHSLLVGEKSLEKSRLYEELAEFFHSRKIKTIEFKEGVSQEDLVCFLIKIGRSPKDIFNDGGAENIINNEKVFNIAVEELDYSQLLMGGGEEPRDIWVYLLQKVVNKNDSNEMRQFSDNFEKNIVNFGNKDFIDNVPLSENINKFLGYLKDKEKDRFRNCAKGLIKSIIRGKDIPQAEKFHNLEGFFKDLSDDDLAETLLEEISISDSFDSFNFQLFSQLIDKERNKSVASSLSKKAGNILRDNPRTRKKIMDFFSSRNSHFIPEIYRFALSSLLKSVTDEDNLSIDRTLLSKNYRLILLNLLTQEKSKDKLNIILAKVLGEWDRIVGDKDSEYLINILETLEKIKKENPSLDSLIGDFHKRISSFVENTIMAGAVPVGFEKLMDYLGETSFDFDLYINRIFKENIINPYMLRVLFKFFPKNLPFFYSNLEKKSYDFNFITKMVGALKEIDRPLTAEVLKHIFHLTNNFIKIEILKAMQALSWHDKQFLLSLLQKGDVILRRESLAILLSYDDMKKIAAQALFSFPSFFGIKNKILQENIKIVEEMKLKEARNSLLALSKKKFFWNASVRKMAGKVLKEWNDR